jgi:hypothetical protein
MSLFDYLIDEYTLTDSEIEQRWNNCGESADNETPEKGSNNK